MTPTRLAGSGSLARADRKKGCVSEHHSGEACCCPEWRKGEREGGRRGKEGGRRGKEGGRGERSEEEKEGANMKGSDTHKNTWMQCTCVYGKKGQLEGR